MGSHADRDTLPLYRRHRFVRACKEPQDSLDTRAPTMEEFIGQAMFLWAVSLRRTLVALHHSAAYKKL